MLPAEVLSGVSIPAVCDVCGSDAAIRCPGCSWRFCWRCASPPWVPEAVAGLACPRCPQVWVRPDLHAAPDEVPVLPSLAELAAWFEKEEAS